MNALQTEPYVSVELTQLMCHRFRRSMLPLCLSAAPFDTLVERLGLYPIFGSG